MHSLLLQLVHTKLRTSPSTYFNHQAKRFSDKHPPSRAVKEFFSELQTSFDIILHFSRQLSSCLVFFMHAWEHKQISNRLFSGTDKGFFIHYTRKCRCQFDIDKLENERHEPFNLKGPWNMWRLIKEKKDPFFGGGFSLLSGQTVIGGYLPAVCLCML